MVLFVKNWLLGHRMAEPSLTNPDASWLGVKLAWLVAGFAGGVVSLSFIKGLTPFQGVLAVFTGVVSSAYLTPVAMSVFGTIAGQPAENGVSFVIGLSAMNIIPGVLKLSEIFKRDPRSFFAGKEGDK